PARQVLQHDEIEVLVGYAGGAEHGPLGERKILAVAAAARERFRCRQPAVGDSELDAVVNEPHAGIDIAVDRLELGDDALSAKRCGEGAGVAADACSRNLVPTRIERATADRQGNAVEHVRTI